MQAMGGRLDTGVKKLWNKQYGGELFFIFPSANPQL